MDTVIIFGNDACGAERLAQEINDTARAKAEVLAYEEVCSRKESAAGTVAVIDGGKELGAIADALKYADCICVAAGVELRNAFDLVNTLREAAPGAQLIMPPDGRIDCGKVLKAL